MERLSMAGVFLVCLVVGASSAEEQNPNTITKTFRTNNGMYGVASIAGVTSRNGRVSSVSGVKFYPSGGVHDMTFFHPNLKSGDKLPEPITFSKEENGRITSGSIKIGPGSVSVSSSARSAFPEKGSGKYGKSSMNSNQVFDDMFFPHPLTMFNSRSFDPIMFNSRSFDPWFPAELSFRPPPQPRFDSLRPGWPYPSFNPINYW